MRMMEPMDLFFITICQSVSFMGKTWCMSTLVLRLLVLLLAGFSLFSDEQERFICNTIQPGCSNVCFDEFAPLSAFRFWLFQLILLCLPHVLFAAYVMHKVLSFRHFGDFIYYNSSSRRGGGGGLGGSTPPFNLENSISSRELSLQKIPLHDFGAPRFYGAYVLVVILRIILEVAFGAGQFFLFGLSIPKRFLCYEAPCTSGVECYISRPTEKTLMLNVMLAVASLSILLSLMDLVSTMQAMVSYRRQREMIIEELSKGEQSSMHTTTTTTEDSDVLLTRRISLSGSSKNALKDEKQVPNNEHIPAKIHGSMLIKNGEYTNDERPDSNDAKTDISISQSPVPVPTHFIHHSHLRPTLYPRPDRRPPPNNTRAQTPMGGTKLSQKQHTAVGENSIQHSDSSESQEKRVWV